MRRAKRAFWGNVTKIQWERKACVCARALWAALMASQKRESLLKREIVIVHVQNLILYPHQREKDKDKIQNPDKDKIQNPDTIPKS